MKLFLDIFVTIHCVDFIQLKSTIFLHQKVTNSNLHLGERGGDLKEGKFLLFSVVFTVFPFEKITIVLGQSYSNHYKIIYSFLPV